LDKIKIFMNKKIFFYIPIILVGIFLFIFGGYDDSPGAQLLGFVVVVLGIVGIIRNRKEIV